MSQSMQNRSGPAASGGPAKDVPMGHSDESDGIEEYDNALPSWWLGIFYLSVIWGVIYAVHYHFIGHRSEAKDYDAEVAAANAKWPPPKVEGVDLGAGAVAAGEKLFMTNCIACHGADLKGGIGPNLLDATWIHGGEAEQIRTTISEGVGTKGMPAWGKVLGPDKVAQLAAFVYTRNQQAPKDAPPTPADGAPTATQPTDGAVVAPPAEPAPAQSAEGAKAGG